MKLTKRQREFAEYYIKSGNATEAAKLAGYSEKTARSIGQENLTKPDISEYIQQRLKAMEKELMADVNEVLKFYTSVMRGDEKDQFGLDASLSDRLKAADSLMKRFAAAGQDYGTSQTEDDPLTKALMEEAERMNHGDLT